MLNTKNFALYPLGVFMCSLRSSQWTAFISGSSLLWDFTQRRLVLVTDVLGQLIGLIFKSQVTNLRCVKSQKSEDLIYTTAEAWYLA
jgi:hypothetical protein